MEKEEKSSAVRKERVIIAVLVTAIILMALFPGYARFLVRMDSNSLAFFMVFSIIIALSLSVVIFKSLVPFNKKQATGSIRDIFLTVGSAFVTFLSSLFLGLKALDYLSSKNTVNVSPAHPLEQLENETLLAVLSLLIAFAGLLSYVFHHVIRKDIKEEIKKDYERERKLSRVDIKRMTAYTHMRLAEFLHEIKKDENGNLDYDSREKVFAQITKAIEIVKAGERICSEVRDGSIIDDDEGYYITKNNLAFYLERKWEHIRNKRTDEEFSAYLEQDEKMRLDYLADKRVAFELFSILREDKAAHMFPALSKEFEKTEMKLRKTFSI